MPPPLPRRAVHWPSSSWGGKLYASGGSGSGGSVTDHAAYDPISDMWTRLDPLPTPA
jgi:hypothetical protein